MLLFMINKKLVIFPLLMVLNLSHPLWADDGISDLTRNPNQNLVEVRDNFNQLENYYSSHHDRRKLFVHIYTMVTDSIENLIDQRKIENGAWLEDVIVGFSEEYRKAVFAYEEKNFIDLSLPWKFDFEQAQLARIGLATQLMLSLDSHILHDLPLVISKDVHSSNELTKYRKDYFRLNKMFIDLIPNLFKAVYQEENIRVLKNHSAAEIVKYKIVDEVVILMRKTAWKRALKLSSLDSEKKRKDYIKYIAIKTEELSKLIVTLDPFLNTKPGQLIPSHLMSNSLRTISQIHTILEAE